MNIFEELERLKQKQITVVLMLNGPSIKNPEQNIFVPAQVIIGHRKELDEHFDPDTLEDRLAIAIQMEGESIEQMFYRAILEFDEKFPEYL